MQDETLLLFVAQHSHKPAQAAALHAQAQRHWNPPRGRRGKGLAAAPVAAQPELGSVNERAQQPADAQQVTPAEVKRPFWEPPEHAENGAATANSGGQQAAGQQRGPVRLLRITVPPVEGRCKCGECNCTTPLACGGPLQVQ